MRQPMTPALLAQMARDWECNPDWTQAELAARYNMSQPQVNLLVRRGFRPARRRQGQHVKNPTLLASIKRDHLWHPELTQFQLAEKYGVSTTTVHKAIAPDVHTIAFVKRDHADGIPLEQIARDNALTVEDIMRILRKQ